MSSYQLDLADCHEWIKALPDNSIDIVCCDPPYHTTQLKFDALEVRWPELWAEIYRVCKPSAVQVMFSAQPFTTDLINSNRKRFRYPLVWAKTMPTGFLDANRRPLRAHEDVLVFSATGSSTYNPQMVPCAPRRIGHQSDHQTSHYGAIRTDNRRIVTEAHPQSVISVGSNGHGGTSLHPTQKPLELLCYLVKTYSNPGDTVLDLFAGSGTTLVACLLTSREALGCEISPEYYAIAKRRLDAVMAQPALEFALGAS
jgi:16S rRNA G966 N2-methylase RsmD